MIWEELINTMEQVAAEHTAYLNTLLERSETDESM